MKICIAGKNSIAIRAIQFLAARYAQYEIVACKNTTDDEADGWQPSFALFCKRHSVPLVKLEELYEVKDLLFISLEFDRIIKPEKFASGRLFNIHFSKLPAYKGMYTSALPLLHGRPESGVTLHRIDKGIDTGSIISQRVFPISQETTARDLYHLYLEHGFMLFQSTVKDLIEDNVRSVPQSAAGSSYYSKAALDYSNVRIDLNKTAWEIQNQVRGFCFREYQLPQIEGEPIYRSEILGTATAGKAGSMVHRDESSIVLNTIDYQIKLFIDRQPALVRTAETGDTAAYRKLKATGYPVDVRTKQGWDALIIACYHNRAAFVEELLNDGWDVNSRSYQGTTALMYAFAAAIRDNEMSALRSLCIRKPDLAVRDRFGKDILEYAREKKNPNVLFFIETLMEKLK